MSLRTLVIAGAITLVAGIVIAFPARIAYRWAAPPGVALNGISGTLWNGGAQEASAAGIYLADLQWRFHPTALLGGRAEFSISAKPVSGFLEGDVAAGAGGDLRLSNVAASLPIAALGGIADVSGLAGNIDLRLQRLVVEDGFPVDAEGSVTVGGLVIRPLAPTPLGDFRADLATADGVVTGAIEDISGVLDVSATAELRPDRSYLFTGLVGSRPDAPPAVVEQLRYLGTADARGRRQFRIEGRL